MHCKLKSLNITYHICENNVRYVCFFHVEHSFCFVIFIATQRNIPHYIWKMLTQRNGTKTRQRSRPSAIFRAMKIFFVFSNCFSESKLLLELMVFPTVHVSFPFVASLSLLSFIFLLVFFSWLVQFEMTIWVAVSNWHGPAISLLLFWVYINKRIQYQL